MLGFDSFREIFIYVILDVGYVGVSFFGVDLRSFLIYF